MTTEQTESVMLTPTPEQVLETLRRALKECASRCRYDGDLFHDQGNWMRRDASWRAAGMANAALEQSAPVIPATHNSGEGDPSVTPDYAGADTPSKD